jgi:NADPH:quinone reductase-like Zn-dependent oxidoreductase
MKLRYKIATSLLVLVAVALSALAYALSREEPCGPPPPPPSDKPLMKAVVYRCYGPPTVLELADIEKPIPADDELLVRIRAAAVNPLDWHYMRGKPYLMRMSAGLGAPNVTRLGTDFAGTVEAVGRSVKRFRPGDEVFGARTGSFAEYISIRESRAVALKPTNVSFEQAAGVAVAALTALQSLRDVGRLAPGQKVLINGASGGVGTFAVQIAKSFGAEVTGVCSTRNVQMVQSIGADHVIDYTRQDFTKSGQRYDVILDNVGNHSLLDVRRVLNPEGILVIIGGPNTGDWIGPMTQPVKAALLSPFISQEMGMILAELNATDLGLVANLMQTGKVTPVIDRKYTLSEVPHAIAYLEEGHARGKVIVVPDQ